MLNKIILPLLVSLAFVACDGSKGDRGGSSKAPSDDLSKVTTEINQVYTEVIRGCDCTQSYEKDLVLGAVAQDVLRKYNITINDVKNASNKSELENLYNLLKNKGR